MSLWCIATVDWDSWCNLPEHFFKKLVQRQVHVPYIIFRFQDVLLFVLNIQSGVNLHNDWWYMWLYNFKLIFVPSKLNVYKGDYFSFLWRNHLITSNTFTIHILPEHCNKKHEGIRWYLKDFVSKLSHVVLISNVSGLSLDRRKISVSD